MIWVLLGDEIELIKSQICHMTNSSKPKQYSPKNQNSILNSKYINMSEV